MILMNISIFKHENNRVNATYEHSTYLPNFSFSNSSDYIPVDTFAWGMQPKPGKIRKQYHE